MVVDPFGKVVAEAPALEPDLLVVDLEADVLRRARAAYPLIRDERLELVERELARVRQARFAIEPEGVDG